MPNRKWLLIILGLICFGVLGLGVAWKSAKPEPVYKDITLSVWVRGPVNTVLDGHDYPEHNKEALYAIGTNGIPFYLEWLQYEPGRLKQAQLFIAEKLNHWFGLDWNPNFIAARSVGAELAFTVLGPRAQVAIPTLVKYATDSSSAMIKARAIRALGDIGLPAVPALLTLMTNHDVSVRSLVLFQARRLDSKRQVIEQVQLLLADPSPRIRKEAGTVLDWLENHPRPQEIQPKE
ncbi:MAG: hypothetical protein JWM16_3841 [Verrucomicrobiales bacterium]|nr:hypothetical protein [Verrucomicrobiales bacterium]